MRDEMKPPIGRTNVVRWFALCLVCVFYLLARETTIGSGERSLLGSRFRFSKHAIDVRSFADGELPRAREVHPSLDRINSWISGTGAGVTLADLDEDGHYNDMLLVDPRLNTLLIQPVHGTGNRYPGFTMDPDTLAFDPAKMAPTGSLVGDFNEDGRSDILVYFWGRTPVIFLRKPSDQASESLGLDASSFQPTELVPNDGREPQRWFTHAATRADLDGDGHLDLLFGNFFQDGADILNADGTGTVSVMQAGKSKATNGGGAKLFLWQPDSVEDGTGVSFRDASAALEEHCGRGWVLAMGAVDLDRDSKQWPGLPEIYIAHDFGPDRLLHNRSTPGNPRFVLCEGRRHFTTPKSFVLGRDSFKGMGLDFADINQDGVFDLYISNIADDFSLHESHFLFVSNGDKKGFRQGIAPFTQMSERYGLSRSGWGWDCRLVDLDNDGGFEAVQATGFAKGTINRWPELHALGTTNDRMISNPRFWPKFEPPTADLSGENVNPFFVFDSKTDRFVDISSEIEMDEFWNTRGLAIADVDGDGLLDFVAANQWEDSVYFHNESPGGQSFLGLHLLLPTQSDPVTELFVRQGNPGRDTPGEPAIGALVTMRSPEGRQRIAYVDGGTGHSGKCSPTVHFGLGANPERDVEVEISWRSRKGSLHKESINVESGFWHTVVLGSTTERETQ